VRKKTTGWKIGRLFIDCFDSQTNFTYNTVQNRGSLSSPRPLIAAALPRNLLLEYFVSECVPQQPWLGCSWGLVCWGWGKSSAWWRGRGESPPWLSKLHQRLRSGVKKVMQGLVEPVFSLLEIPYTSVNSRWEVTQ